MNDQPSADPGGVPSVSAPQGSAPAVPSPPDTESRAFTVAPAMRRGAADVSATAHTGGSDTERRNELGSAPAGASRSDGSLDQLKGAQLLNVIRSEALAEWNAVAAPFNNELRDIRSKHEQELSKLNRELGQLRVSDAASRAEARAAVKKAEAAEARLQWKHSHAWTGQILLLIGTIGVGWGASWTCASGKTMEYIGWVGLATGCLATLFGLGFLFLARRDDDKRDIDERGA